MDDLLAKPEQAFNRDVIPTHGLHTAFPNWGPLIEDDGITAAFSHHEKLATNAKRVHTVLGRLALLSVYAGMVIFAYMATLGHQFPVHAALPTLGVLLIAAAVVLQLGLQILGAKRKWLFHRFAAERVRCLKFQAFALAPTIEISNLAAQAAAFYQAGLARLRQELQGGETAVADFNPEGGQPEKHGALADWQEHDLRDAIALYDTLRIGVQLQHCKGQLEQVTKNQRRPHVLGELLFAVGACLALIDLVALAGQSISSGASLGEEMKSTLHFVTLAVFISSAVVGVFQRGSAQASSGDRYRDYIFELERLRPTLSRVNLQEFASVVTEIELRALRELKGFVRDAKEASYLI